MNDTLERKTVHSYFDLLSADNGLLHTNDILELIGSAIKDGLDPNERNEDGVTVLSRLIEFDDGILASRSLSFLTILIEAGANPLLPYRPGETSTILDEALDLTSERKISLTKYKLLLTAAMEQLDHAGPGAIEPDKSNLFHRICRTYDDRWYYLPYIALAIMVSHPDLAGHLCRGRDEKGATALQKLWEWACSQDHTVHDLVNASVIHFWAAHETILEYWQGADGEQEHYDSLLSLAKEAQKHNFPFLGNIGGKVLTDIQAREITLGTQGLATAVAKRRF